jgi:hypothetical protein
MGRTKKGSGSPQQPVQDGWQVFVEANDAKAGTLTHLVLLQPPTANIKALKGDGALGDDHAPRLGPRIRHAWACTLTHGGWNHR